MGFQLEKEVEIAQDIGGQITYRRIGKMSILEAIYVDTQIDIDNIEVDIEVEI